MGKDAEKHIRLALRWLHGDERPAGTDPWDSASGQLPAGGVQCEAYVERAVDHLRQALGMPPLYGDTPAQEAARHNGWSEA